MNRLQEQMSGGRQLKHPASFHYCWPCWMYDEVKITHNCCLELTGLRSNAVSSLIKFHLVGVGSTKQLWEPVLVCCLLHCAASQRYLHAPLLCVLLPGVGDGVRKLYPVLCPEVLAAAELSCCGVAEQGRCRRNGLK